MDREVLEEVRDAITMEPRIHEARDPIRTRLERGDLLLEGEVADVASKKLALERAGAVRGVGMIVDRLRVEPAAEMSDDEIEQKLVKSFLQEAAFGEILLRIRHDGKTQTVQTPAGRTLGSLDIEVRDGVVTLDGEVPSLSHKRLAGVLAWWIPGARDVVNGLGVEPYQEDDDAEIVEAVRLVLEKDPLVDVDEIRIYSRDAVVVLEGRAGSIQQREAAEFDAWCVFGVDQVENFIEVPGRL